MLGYILALCLGGLLLALGFMALARSGARAGRRTGERPPVQPTGPAADEPTPDRSITASPAERDAARRVTPPA